MTPPMMQPPVLFAHTNGDLGYRHPVTAAEMAPVNNPGNPQAAHQDQFHPLSILPRFSSTWPLKRCLCQHNSSRRQLHCQLKSGSALHLKPSSLCSTSSRRAIRNHSSRLLYLAPMESLTSLSVSSPPARYQPRHPGAVDNPSDHFSASLRWGPAELSGAVNGTHGLVYRSSSCLCCVARLPPVPSKRRSDMTGHATKNSSTSSRTTVDERQKEELVSRSNKAPFMVPNDGALRALIRERAKFSDGAGD